MIKIENYEIIGWEHAIRGMRNPMNSRDKSDSNFENFEIGKNDRDLAKWLRNLREDSGKFMQMVTVRTDIVAPLYWWEEFSAYEVGAVPNFFSTMRRIHHKEFRPEDFSYEHLRDFGSYERPAVYFESCMCNIIDTLNKARRLYLKTGDKEYWWQIVQILPFSYNQKQTVVINYEVLSNIYKSQKRSKLDEWNDLCNWIETLPYAELITGNTSEN